MSVSRRSGGTYSGRRQWRSDLWLLALGLVLTVAVPAAAQLPYTTSAVQIENFDVAVKGSKLSEIELELNPTIPAGGASLDLLCEAEAFNRGRGAKLRFIVEAAVGNPATGQVIQNLGKIKVKTKNRTGLGAKRVTRLSQDLTGQVAVLFAGRIKGRKQVDHVKFSCRLELS